MPGGDVELHTREGVVYRFFSPLTLGLTAGKLQGVTDRNANSATLLYNAGGLLAAANDTSGASLQFTYNNSACSVPVIASVTDHTGRVVTYQYGTGCNLIGVERYGSPWHSYGYLPGSLLATDTNALGQTTTYGYDGNSRVVSMQLPGTTAAQTYNYGAPGVTVVTDFVGRATQVQFNLNSKVTQVANLASGMTMPYSYDARGNLAHLGGSNGNDYEYDTRGNLIRLESAHPTPGNPARLETLFTYDTCNQLVSTTDAMGRVTTNSLQPGDLSSDRHDRPARPRDNLHQQRPRTAHDDRRCARPADAQHV